MVRRHRPPTEPLYVQLRKLLAERGAGSIWCGETNSGLEPEDAGSIRASQGTRRHPLDFFTDRQTTAAPPRAIEDGLEARP